MRTFIPFGDRVLVKPDAVQTKTTGLATPQSQKEVPTEGLVVAAGPKSLAHSGIDKDGKLTRLGHGEGVIPGERVQFAKYAGRDVMHNGVTHKLLRLEECEGLIEETPE